ncbi:MAG: NADH-quinone oxidoreductase subunit N, partial [Gemmatimonadales bacterium]
MPTGDVVPELVLLGGAVLVLLYALFAPRRWQPGAAALAVVVLLATVGATLALPRDQALTFFDTYARDGAAIWAKLIVCGVTAVSVALSVAWFETDRRQGEYYALLLLSALGAVLLAGAADLMQVVLALLLSSATGYTLAAYHRRSRRAAEAAMKYYLLGALTNGALVFGVVLLFGLASTTTFPGLLAGLREADPFPLAVATGLVVVGIAFKMGAVPAHAWMPDLAEGAPAPVAAFLTVAPKVGALVALARLAVVLPETQVNWRLLVAIIAAVTMTLGNLAALRQEDVRRLLGWSAVSQTGYGLMAVVALGRGELAIPSLLFFLVAYALANLAAFGVVVTLLGRTERAAYAGLGRSHPVLGLVVVVSFLSLVGIPPLAGFTAKLLLFGATIAAGYTWLAVLALVNTVVSLAYYARVIGPMYFETGPAREAHAPSLAGA